jgi:nitrate/nitrite transporter NarK
MRPVEQNKVVAYSWVVFSVVVGAQGVALGFSVTCLPPFFTTIAAELQLTSTQVGMAWGMIGLGAMLFSIIGGLVSDRIGVRWTGFLGLLLMALGGALRGYADTYLQFIAVMLIFGIGLGIAGPNFSRALSQWFPPERRGMANGVSVAAAAFGGAVAMAISVSTIAPLVGGWRNIMIIFGCLTFMLAIAWVILVKERLFGERLAPGLSSVMKGFTLVLRSRPVWVLSIIGLLLLGHAQAWSSHMPGFFENKYGMTNAAAGQFVSIALFSGIIAAILGPTLSDRSGLRKPAMLIACVIGAVCNMIQGSFLGPVLFVILILLPYGFGIIGPLLFTVPFELRELHHTIAGAAIGMILTMQNIGAFVYPVISGKLIDLFAPNYYPFFAAQMMAFAVSFFLVWWLLPETGPRVTKAEATREA